MKKPIIIMIANQKGGVGKSEAALELCNAFGKKNYKVLAIDLDPQGSLSNLTGADTNARTIKEVLDSTTTGNFVLPSEVIQHMKNYDVIIGNSELAKADTMYGGPEDGFILADALETVDEYDFIILDSAPGRSALLYMEYVAADYVIAPTEPDVEAEKGLYQIKKDIGSYRNSHAKFLGVFMNKYTQNTRIHQAMFENLKNIEDELGAKRFESTIRNTVKAQEARLAKMPISDYAKNSGIAEDYSNLVDEIILRIKEYEKR